MSDTVKCEHDKVYSNQVLLSYPPQYQWICRKCLATGIERHGSITVINEYDMLIRQKNKGKIL